MRRRTAVRIVALPFAAGLLIAVGAGPAVSSPPPASQSVAPLDGEPSGSGSTGHAEHDAHTPTTAEPTATADEHSGHDHAEHGSDDWTKVRPQPGATTSDLMEQDCGCGSDDHSSHGTTGEHDDHGTTDDHGTADDHGTTGHGTSDDHGSHGTADEHGAHGGAPAEGPSDGTRTAVLGGFGAVNGAALVGAGLLRRRTAGKRERHLTARAAARPAAAPPAAARPTRDDMAGDER